MTIIVKDVHLDGIPCQAEIDPWPAEPQTLWEPVYLVDWELYRVLDRRGRPAAWLERKLADPKIERAFYDSIDIRLANMIEQDAEDAEDAVEYHYDAMMDRRFMDND